MAVVAPKDDEPKMLLPGMPRADELNEPLRFSGLDKTTVLQSTKVFNAATVDPGKVLPIMVQLLYILQQNPPLSSSEANDVFYNVTKLFQSDNETVRRLSYILVKELADQVETAFVISNTLLKDLNSSNDEYKANSIRCMRKIANEPANFGPIERYLKQAVIAKSQTVASAALVTGIHLSNSHPDLVKRWSTEVSEAMKNRGYFVQYHALALLHRLRRNDHSSVVKLVQQVNVIPIRWPMSLCLVIRLAAGVLEAEASANAGELFDYVSNPLYQFIVGCLRSASEMVVFEATKAIVNLPGLPSRELNQVIVVLHLYLTSQRIVLKFATVRLLSRIASIHPALVSGCNIDMEGLIGSPNRYIATLAITTLLKSGNEFSIDRLLKQISGFLSDIGDEFRIVVVDALKVLCVKYQYKHHTLLTFLADALRDDGGFEFKRALVDAICTVLGVVPNARDEGLLILCEFIEDCEFNSLSQKILHLLGREGPSTSEPHKFIRYIYNRSLLEPPSVRAAAVSALAKFAAACEPLRSSILILLNRCVLDSDDEVRDRAVFYTKVLSSGKQEDAKRYILDVSAAAAACASAASAKAAGASLTAYSIGGARGESFEDLAAAATLESDKEANPLAYSRVAVPPTVRPHLNELREVPAVAAFLEHLVPGQPPLAHRSSEPLVLTDLDTEYVVHVLKHSTRKHLILQFRCANTTDEHAFTNVRIDMDMSAVEGLGEPVVNTTIPVIMPGETLNAFAVFPREVSDETPFGTGSIVCTLVFTVKEVNQGQLDDSDEGFEASYSLEDTVINVCDYVTPITPNNFNALFDSLDAEETHEEYTLDSFSVISKAVEAIVDFLGMYAVGGCKDVPMKDGKAPTNHKLELSGTFCTGEETAVLLVKAKVFLNSSGTISVDWILRGASEHLREYLSGELFS